MKEILWQYGLLPGLTTRIHGNPYLVYASNSPSSVIVKFVDNFVLDCGSIAPPEESKNPGDEVGDPLR